MKAILILSLMMILIFSCNDAQPDDQLPYDPNDTIGRDTIVNPNDTIPRV